MNLAEKLAAAAGRPSGFDYLRIALALAVAAIHIPYLTYGTELDATIAGSALPPLGKAIAFALRPATGAVLPMFFALSGFLVAGSLERCRTLRAFVGLRLLRIFPALAVETVISALIVGPLFTHATISDYFGDPLFRRYFLNMTGDPQYFLPGVFSDAAQDKAVNGQLWSVPFELLCYIAITAMAMIGIRRWPTLTPALTVTSIVVFAGRQFAVHGDASYVPPGLLLVWSFLVGGSLYFLRSRTPWSPGLAIAALALTALSLCEGYWNYLLPFGVGYLTVFIGATSAPRVRWLVGADYSYGVYLYHWVIIQAVADRLPRIWFVNAAVSFPAMIAVAALSWHLLEHRALALRAPLMIDDAKGRGAALLLSAAASLILLLVAALRHLG